LNYLKDNDYKILILRRIKFVKFYGQYSIYIGFGLTM